MKKNKRKIIKRTVGYFFGTILFFVVATILILWALGYRLDTMGFKLSQTGILSLKTNESSYDIFISSQKYWSGHNQTSIKNLLPKDYLARIEKDGFVPWIKTVNIEPRQITRQEKIILFPKNTNPQQFYNDAYDYQITSDGQSAIVLNNARDTLQKININDGKSLGQIKLTNIESFNPSFNGNRVVIRQNKPEDRYLVITFNGQNEVKELSKEPDKFNQIKWLPQNDQTLILVYNNSLYTADTGSESIGFNLVRPDVHTFNLANDSILYIASDKGKFSLLKTNLNLSNPEKIIDLDNPNFQIFPSPSSQELMLLDSQENLFFVKNNGLEKIDDSVKNIKWATNNKDIAYNTNFEIWLLQVNGNDFSKSLVSRFSQKISNLGWYPDLNHIIFSLDSKLNVIEIDGTNLVELTDFQADPQKISLNETNKVNIYLLNKKESNALPALFYINFERPK